MAVTPKRLKSGYGSVNMGDGASPEVFTKLCGLTSFSYAVNFSTQDDEVDICDEPEGVPAREVVVTGKSATINVAGFYNRTQSEIMRTAKGATKNYTFKLTEPSGDAVSKLTVAGAFIMTQHEISGGRNAEYFTFTATFESTGAVTETNA
jgi:Phage tail tube protein